MQNLFVIIVVAAIFIMILVAVLRGNKGETGILASPAQQALAKAAAASQAQPAAVDDPRLLVVLAAAAYSVLGQNVTIVSVQPASAEWGAQGRRDIFLSHKIR
jgi:hypothetical protein